MINPNLDKNILDDKYGIKSLSNEQAAIKIVFLYISTKQVFTDEEVIDEIRKNGISPILKEKRTLTNFLDDLCKYGLLNVANVDGHRIYNNIVYDNRIGIFNGYLIKN